MKGRDSWPTRARTKRFTTACRHLADEKYVAGASACGLYATDLPSAITSVDDGKRSKRIEHDHGCSEAPGARAGLENKIDQVAGTLRWTGH